MVQIITDSSSDISQEEAKAYQISVIPLSISFGGESFQDGIDINHEQFYEKLQHTKELPKTSQASPEDFAVLFEQAKQAGGSVVAVLISGNLSGTCQSAQIAKDMVGYDDIYIVDSLTTILGLRLLVELAIAERNAGKTAAEIASVLESKKEKVFLGAAVDTLEYFYKGGRLSKTSAVAGTLLNFKPLITLKDGKVALDGKARGYEKAIDQVLKKFDSKNIDRRTPIYFGYTGVRNMCDQLMAEAEKRFEIQNSRICPVGGVVGTHVGPNACVIVFLKK